eukprot:5283324-Prorocentrum_lima.AAC.1
MSPDYLRQDPSMGKGNQIERTWKDEHNEFFRLCGLKWPLRASEIESLPLCMSGLVERMTEL